MKITVMIPNNKLLCNLVPIILAMVVPLIETETKGPSQGRARELARH